MSLNWAVHSEGNTAIAGNGSTVVKEQYSCSRSGRALLPRFRFLCQTALVLTTSLSWIHQVGLMGKMTNRWTSWQVGNQTANNTAVCVGGVAMGVMGGWRDIMILGGCEGGVSLSVWWTPQLCVCLHSITSLRSRHRSSADILGFIRVLTWQLSLPGQIFTFWPLQMTHALETEFGSSALYVTTYSSIKKWKASRSFVSLHFYKVQVHESQRLKRLSVKRKTESFN